jgi:hypothetical protein
MQFSSKHFWIWSDADVWNGGTKKDIGVEIDEDVNETVGMAVYPGGELHVFADGEDLGMPWTNLPSDVPLFGVVGLENHGPLTRGCFRLGKKNH